MKSMPTFAYTAVDDEGRETRGKVDAENEAALDAQLREHGRYLVRASERGSAARTGLFEIRILEWVTKREVIFFTTQLSTMMATGVGILEGLADIEAQIKKAPMRRVVAALRRDIEGGMSLSQALSRHPKAFSDLYVNIVRAGEATGTVERALGDLVGQLEWQEEVSSRIREAATYPAIVVTMLIALTTVLVGFTIPRFLQTYAQLHVDIELPLPSRILLAVSTIVRATAPVMIPALLVAFVGLNMYNQTPAGAVRLSRWLLKLPIIGELARKIALSRFAHYFGTLHHAGMEVAPSLELVERLIGNAYLAQQFRQALGRVLAGESLSRALQQAGEFPPIVVQMIALGERTGSMTKSLEDVRRYFDREVERTVKRGLALFGPAMLVVLATVFVIMALAFYLPLFQLLRGLNQ